MMRFMCCHMYGFKTLFSSLILGSLLVYLTIWSKLSNSVHLHNSSILDTFSIQKFTQMNFTPTTQQNVSYFESVSSLLSLSSVPSTSEEAQPVSASPKDNLSHREKLILLWSPCYGETSWFARNETFQNCPFKCDLSVDKIKYNISDAIIYDGLSGHTLPSFRASPNQIWMIFRIESPAYSYDIPTYNNMFNWTITYRLDSDVTWNNNVLVPISEAQNNPPQVIPSLKSLKTKKLIAWIVSNCITPGGREEYAEELSKHVTVDIFGKCGTLNLTCENGNFNTECYKYVAKEYKFYLAFENSICEDYVTEKLWYPLRFGIIPIVYGHPSFKKVAPPGSYINVDDFNSPKELAIYLDYLNKNSTQYLKYFEWTKKYVILGILESLDRTWCKICSKLHKTDFVKDRKVYSSVHQWFNNNSTGTSLCSGSEPKIFALTYYFKKLCFETKLILLLFICIIIVILRKKNHSEED